MGGAREVIERLKPAASPDVQEFTFAPRKTERIVVTVKGVAEGSTYNDMCIAEMTFGE